MTSALSRRGFLGRSAATSLGIAFAGSIDAIAGTAANAATRSAAGYGPLVPDPAGILALPRGFSYTIIAQAGSTLLDDGSPTPTDMDGMGAFATRTGTTLVYNHEANSTVLMADVNGFICPSDLPNPIRARGSRARNIAGSSMSW